MDAGVINGFKKGKSCDMVPMGVAQEDVDGLMFFGVDDLAEGANPSSGIKDNEIISVADFKTASIAAKAGIIGS